MIALVRTLLLSGALAMLSGGCRDTPPASRAASTGAALRSLVIAQPTTAITLDPHAHDDGGTYAVLSHFYEPLVAFGPAMELQPGLATSWDSPSDTSLRLRLRTGVVFHDGRPLEAADVVASLERARASPTSRVRHYLQPITGVHATADGAVEITTRQAAPLLIAKLGFVMVVPRDAPPLIDSPVGTGPYRFVSGAPNGAISGRRFEAYWGQGRGAETVRFVPLPGSQERAAAVPDGRADVVACFPPEHWEQANRRGDLRTLSSPGLAVSYLTFSVEAGSPFSERGVRQAVALALDRAELARRVAGGTATPLDQLVPRGVFGHVDDLARAEPDPQAARGLLASAGLAGRVTAPLFVPESLAPVAGEVARQMEDLGLRLQPTPLPWSEFLARWYRREMSISVSYPWVAASGDATDILDDLLHTPGEGYGGTNTLGFHSRELDLLVEEASRSAEAPRRRELLAEATRIVRREAPVIPLLLHSNLYAVRRGLVLSPRLDQFVLAWDVHPEH